MGQVKDDYDDSGWIIPARKKVVVSKNRVYAKQKMHEVTYEDSEPKPACNAGRYAAQSRNTSDASWRTAQRLVFKDFKEPCERCFDV